MNINPNNSNPLDQLPPIILPEAVSWWPLAPGWWLLVFIAIALISALIILATGYYQSLALKRAAKKEAHRLLAQYQQDTDAHTYLFNCNQLLRRFCLQQYPDINSASVSGEQWLKHLDLLANKHLFYSDSGKILLSIYQPAEALSSSITQSQIEALHQLVNKWLKQLKTSTAESSLAKYRITSEKRSQL